MSLSLSLFAPTRLLALACAGTLVAAGCGDESNLDDSVDVVDSADGDPDAEPLPDAEPPPPLPDAEPPPPPDAIISLACSLEELQPILTCAQESCIDDLTAECVALNCGLLLLGLSPSCRECALTAIASGGDLAAIAGACISGPDLGGLGGGLGGLGGQ
jgi:hypothetical protein